MLGLILTGVYVAAGDMEMDSVSEIITGMGLGPLNEGWVKSLKVMVHTHWKGVSCLSREYEIRSEGVC
jgi:hypothetical protein